MSVYITGYPHQCLVNGNVIIMPVGQWDPGVMRKCGRVGDYISNVEAGVMSSSQINTVNGEQADGTFWVTVDDASAFTSGDMMSPSLQSTVFYNTDPSANYTAASGGDTMILWYADAYLNPTHIWSVNGGTPTTKGVNIWGGNRNIEVRSTDNRSFYELDDITNDVEVYCLYLLGDVYVFELTGSNGQLVTVDRCHCTGGASSFQVSGADRLTVQNSFSENSTSFGYNSSADPEVRILYSTFLKHPSRGVDCDNRSNLYTRGVISFNNGANDWQSTANGDHDWNGSTDATAPGANSAAFRNLKFSEMNFFEQRYGTRGNTPRVASNLKAGIPVAGVTEDFFGNIRDAVTPTLGAQECCNPIDLPDVNSVVSPATVDYEPGTYVPALEAEVQLNKTFGEDNGTARTGTFNPSPTPPDSPTLTASVSGTTVTFTITGASADTSNAVYIRTAGGEWDASPTVTIPDNGSDDATIDPGDYFAKVLSTNLQGLSSPGATDPVPFRVADDTKNEAQYRVTQILKEDAADTKILVLEKVEQPIGITP